MRLAAPSGPMIDDGAPVCNSPRGQYADPLDIVWLAAAKQAGLRVERSGEVYASWDGRGELLISTPDHFDPDDSVAQLILHEICHAVVEWPEGMDLPDWGLANEDHRDLVREQACHRVQAALLDKHGLRGVLAPTTEHRSYYDAIGLDPMEGSDEATELARRAWARLPQSPFAGPLERALEITGKIAALVQPLANEPIVWARAQRDSSSQVHGVESPRA